MKVSLKSINIAILVFAIFAKSFFEYFIPDLPTDKAIQISSAAQLSKGNLISIAYVDPQDLSKTIQKPLGLWPPGYASCVATILYLGIDWIAASIILDILCVLIFFLSWYFIFVLIRDYVSPYLPALVFLYWAFALNPFRALYSTDLIGLVFFTLGFYALLFAIFKAKYPRQGIDFSLVVLLSLAFFSCSFFHYGYYPVSLAFPVIFLVYAVVKEHKWIQTASFALVGTLLLMAIQIAYLKLMIGDANYLNNYYPNAFETLHFNNLRKFDPFLLTPFFDKHLLTQFLGNEVFQVLAFVFSLLLFALLFKAFYRKFNLKKWKDWNNLHWFLFASLMLIFIKIILLVGLSLLYPPQRGIWTYVQETRYFSVSLMFIPVFLFLLLLEKNNTTRSWIRFSNIFYTGIIGCTLVFSIIVFSYQLQKYAISNPVQNMFRYYHYNEDVYNYIKENSLGKRENIIYCSAHPDNYIDELFMMEGIPKIYFDNLPAVIKCSEDTEMLIAVDKLHESNPKFKKLLETFSYKKVESFKDTSVRLFQIIIPKNI